jgi:hypothetical protein
MFTREMHKPLTGLVADLWRESADLVRAEAALAKAELTEKGMQLGVGVAWLAAGGAILLAGAICLLVAAIAALAMALPEDHAAWMSPLIIGILVAGAGIVLIVKGRKNLAPLNLKPTQTVKSVRDDVKVLKEHLP